MTTNTIETSVHFQNGRSAVLGDKLGFRRWMKVIDDALVVGPMGRTKDDDSAAFITAMDEAFEGAKSAGSGDTFKNKRSQLRQIRSAFPTMSVDELVDKFGNINKAVVAARRELGPKDAEGNPVVTVKSGDERCGDIEAAARRAHGAEVSFEDALAALKRGYGMK